MKRQAQGTEMPPSWHLLTLAGPTLTSELLRLALLPAEHPNSAYGTLGGPVLTHLSPPGA
jgi:hypothetical protein